MSKAKWFWCKNQLKRQRKNFHRNICFMNWLWLMSVTANVCPTFVYYVIQTQLFSHRRIERIYKDQNDLSIIFANNLSHLSTCMWVNIYLYTQWARRSYHFWKFVAPRVLDGFTKSNPTQKANGPKYNILVIFLVYLRALNIRYSWLHERFLNCKMPERNLNTWSNHVEFPCTEHYEEGI